MYVAFTTHLFSLIFITQYNYIDAAETQSERSLEIQGNDQWKDTPLHWKLSRIRYPKLDLHVEVLLRY